MSKEKVGDLSGMFVQASGQIDPKAMHYMDLVALSVMRGRHVNPRALRANVYKGRCQVSDWETVMADALAHGLNVLDISA